jgi:cell division protein FtsA
MSKLNNSFIAVLDIGTSKIVCLIAKANAEGAINIAGIGHQVSQGIKSGVITDIRLAEQAIRSAVGSAEHMSGINIDSIIVNISGNKQKSQTVKASLGIKGLEITDREISRLISQGSSQHKTEGQEIIHAIPIDFSIDGTTGITNPRGMYGDKLGATLHLITTSSSNVMNLTNCLAQCHLNVEGYIASPYASGTACISDEEKELGVTLLDFGGGTSSIAVFKGGNIIYTDTIPAGGMHITNDLAIGLSTNVETAERMKALYGNVVKTSKDDREIIDIPQSDSDVSHVPKSSLINIIRPRIDEILDMVESRLKDSGVNNIGGQIVITGGGSQLGGLSELVSQRFKRQVRMGAAKRIEGMAESTKGPAFSTCAGMLLLARQQHINKNGKNFITADGFIGRIIEWLRDNF